MASLLFGIHVAIVNGPLAQIAADLGFASSVGLKGLVRSCPSAKLASNTGSAARSQSHCSTSTAWQRAHAAFEP